MAPRPQTNFGALALGGVPRVVGTITTSEGLFSLTEFPCDLVEVRLDKTGQPGGWLARCKAIQALGKPIILTVRSRNEGGSWDGPDAERLPVLEKALAEVAAVDIELASNIAPMVGRIAKAFGKAVIVSHHNFDKTPLADDLQPIIARAESIGSVCKVATMVHSEADAEQLRTLLRRNQCRKLCVIGMGAAWSQLRVQLPKLGSCLAYGYLDTPGAPGQTSAAEMQKALRA